MASLRQYYRLEYLLRAAGLARSVFYYQMKRAQGPDKYAELKEKIKDIYTDKKGFYGYRRITYNLNLKEFTANHKTVHRLMRELGLRGKTPKRRNYNSYDPSIDLASPNLLQRQFKSDKPLQKLVTDVTQISSKPDGKRLYLSPLMDLFNGEICSFQMHTHPTVNFVLGMFNAPVLQQKSKGRLCHSDQGLQYKNPAYRRKLKELGITQSMSRKANCLDNACIESFFGTLKNELPELENLSIRDMKKEIRQYIKYYNEERIRSCLKMSPKQYRANYEKKHGLTVQ